MGDPSRPAQVDAPLTFTGRPVPPRPVAEPADADFIMKNTRHCHGFYGASSMERLPVERALTEQVRKFKAIGAR